MEMLGGNLLDKTRKSPADETPWKGLVDPPFTKAIRNMLMREPQCHWEAPWWWRHLRMGLAEMLPEYWYPGNNGNDGI